MGIRPTFGLVDYCVFGATLLLSLLIGVYHAVRGKQTNEDLLLGGRSMSVLPVAVSIMVSFLSAILILGSPAEMYMNGVQYWICNTAFFVILPAVAYLFLPIFYRCGVTSVYEYLHYRFDNRLLRTLCVLVYLLRTSLYMAIALYAPSLALSFVTGLPLWIAIVGSAAVGTLYTAFGGLKAVVWADVLQAAIMAAGMIAMIVQGAINVGGFTNIFTINAEHQRMTFFDFTLNPWQRHNFWNLFFGTLFLWTTVFGVNQTSIQRYISLPTLKAARIACLLNAPATVLYTTLACLTGLAIFATYAECDPLKVGLVEKKDQLVPYFVLDQMSYLTGLPGLFVACIMSGALSTISSGLNSLAAITWQDFISNIAMFQNMTEVAKSWVTRIISLLYGVMAVGLAFLVSKFGGVLQASLAINGALSGPVLGVFSLGLFIPFANGKGAVVGMLSASALSMWAVFGAYGSGKRPAPLPTSTAGCNVTALSLSTPLPIELTTPVPTGLPEEDSWIDQYVYGISYQLYNMLGCLLCVIIGSIVSLLTGCNDREVNKSLVNPLAYKLLNWVNCCRRDSSDAKYAADNPIFTMSTYKQTAAD
ncbi:Sodium-coupled monocarboxylate transporter 1 [Amphibalanus amphitrite]|uniref:Sodium-coupled monocarboxylate transporter 1 n=1 Tax=Amphibalanus amphitrite TaxID=1232801 RepID=A0A6A4WK39_AMPAM|nr:Sodium-coupled monocarboxylate transporter 1 [Amphibalanus amphitrite]KAF0307767.1 Sodium-coupled monocarboxylate transporter 1 [Amphibalanus amphitrite]